MLSFKTAAEFCEINCRSIVKTIALLPTRPPLLLCSDSTTFGMADNLHKAIRSMSLDDDDPITFPDEPQFRVFDANATSILGRLLNPDAQNMARMIEFMPTAWNYVRAKVAFTEDSPAFEAKNLNLPSGDVVVIEYEYEKIHKRCFGCFRMTHEKSSCPYSKKKNLRLVSKEAAPVTKDPVTPLIEGRLEGLPGFRLLFPQLPPEESRMAIQYVSHANETKRKARILRVQQAIEVDKDNPPASLTKFSHELNKEKGHVFDYGRTVSDQDIEVVKRPTPTLSAPVFGRLSFPTEVSSGESSGAPSRHKNPMVFSMGASGSCFTGMPKSKKKERRRPPA
ncbi:hypothetical protein Bca101_072918 [Brassica carinata]